ncbi:hypothetical protein X801_06531, partial [Opisthorchis viverrini]
MNAAKETITITVAHGDQALTPSPRRDPLTSNTVMKFLKNDVPKSMYFGSAIFVKANGIKHRTSPVVGLRLCECKNMEILTNDCTISGKDPKGYSRQACEEDFRSEGPDSRQEEESKEEGELCHLYLHGPPPNAPGHGITSKGMSIMNFSVNIFERIAAESSRLTQHNRYSTTSSIEIQAVVRLLV